MYSYGVAGFGGRIIYFTPVLILTLLRHIFLRFLQFLLQFFGNKKKRCAFNFSFHSKEKQKVSGREDLNCIEVRNSKMLLINRCFINRMLLYQ